jgi:hypothetical protein
MQAYNRIHLVAQAQAQHQPHQLEVHMAQHQLEEHMVQ